MYKLILKFDREGSAVVTTPWYVINKNGSFSFEGVETAWVKEYNVRWCDDE